MNGESGHRIAVPRGFMAMVVSFIALAPLSTDFYLPVLPSMSADLSASTSQTQLVITAVLVGMALGQLVGGPLSDQRGRKGTLVVGLIGFVVTTVLSAWAPNISILIGIRFVSGLMVAFVFVVARAMVADVYPGAEAARGFALLGSVTGIVPVLAPIAGGLLALIMGWRGIFLVLAALGVLILLVAMTWMPETMPSHARQQKGMSHGLRDLGACLTSRAFMTYVLCIAMAGGVLFSYISTSPFVLEDVYGLTPTQFSAVFAANSVGIVIAAMIGRRLVARSGPSRLLWAGQFIALAGSAIVLVGLVIESLPVVLVGLFIAVASVGISFANATALGIQVSPVRAGAASALLGISGFLVGGLLAPLGGLGSVALGALMLGFAILGLLLHRLLGSAAPDSSAPKGVVA